ncbi:MAG: hypothetical protein AVDCRST_MAG34-3124, partial [uncultured Nocardioidaceae bacterium]
CQPSSMPADPWSLPAPGCRAGRSTGPRRAPGPIRCSPSGSSWERSGPTSTRMPSSTSCSTGSCTWSVTGPRSSLAPATWCRCPRTAAAGTSLPSVPGCWRSTARTRPGWLRPSRVPTVS